MGAHFIEKSRCASFVAVGDPILLASCAFLGCANAGEPGFIGVYVEYISEIPIGRHVEY